MKIIILLISVLFSLNIFAQVGINTDTPDQALDVEGKIEIADDANTATEGSIRYNTTTDDFEGYDGINWFSLTGRNEEAKVTSPNDTENPYINWTLNPDNTVTFQVDFDQPMDPASFIVGESFVVDGDSQATGTISWNASNTVLTFQSTNTFFDFSDGGCSFRLTIHGDGPDVVKDAKGFTIDGDGNDVAGGDLIYFYQYLC